MLLLEILNSGFSICDLFQTRNPQMIKPIKKKALGGISIIPFVTNQLSPNVELKISVPQIVPLPNNSLKNATVINIKLYPIPFPMPSNKLGIGAFFIANASALPITIQLVIINPTKTDNCLLMSYATALRI